MKGVEKNLFPRSVSPGVWMLPRPVRARQIFLSGGWIMQTRVAVMSIIVEDPDSVEKLNALLHSFGEHIIGRMGIPYRRRGINIIAIALDAPQDTISTLAGKIGGLRGISVKTAYSSVISQEES